MTVLEAVLAGEADYTGWREQARRLVARSVPPHQVVWRVQSATPDLFSEAIFATSDRDDHASPFTVPRRFLDIAPLVALHRDPQRFSLLYRLLWRIIHAQEHVLADRTDADVDRAEAMARAVRRDMHKMKGFVRFREASGDRPSDPVVYLAWFEPDHFIVEAVAPFFRNRFGGMCWSILTPDRSAHWDGRHLTFGGGGRRADVPAEDALEGDWRAYYASIFNPARLKPAAMRSQMPVKYWKNLPEARLIRPLTAAAATRTEAMLMTPPSPPKASTAGLARMGPSSQSPAARPGADRQPDGPEGDQAGPDHDRRPPMEEVRRRIRDCRACPLWEPATQAVCGEGPVSAPMMLIGEQPGDQEDIAGRPFVGPAGVVLNRALHDAGIERDQTYVTNAVKHFKFVIRGKRRLHQKPTIVEMAACRPWLDQELDLVDPKVVIALGATASRALLQREVRLKDSRGQVIELGRARAVITVHPSFLLRQRDARAKAAEYEHFVRDLAFARQLLHEVEGNA